MIIASGIYLSAEDLRRYRHLAARYEATKCESVRTEVEVASRIIEDYWSFLGGLVERYAIDADRNWQIDQFTGHVTYEE